MKIHIQNNMEHTTIIDFWDGDEPITQVNINGSIPNVVVGQLFVYDHPNMSRALMDAVVTKISHAVMLGGKVITYIDVDKGG